MDFRLYFSDNFNDDSSTRKSNHQILYCSDLHVGFIYYDIVFYGERLVPVLKIKRRNFDSLIPLVRTKQFFNPSQERSNPITNVKPNAP